MFKIMIMTTILLSITFIFLNHPLAFGVTLLIQTLIVSLMTGMMTMNFWFSYILFLIMVGGMLVLFIYMTSVASNEKFKLSPKMITASMMYLSLSMIILMIDPMFLNIMNNYELIQNPVQMELSMSKYMNFPNNLLVLSMIIYLLISLIMVVKITNIQYGPLRQKF